MGDDIQVMPAAFLGHGSPMNAIETNRFTEAWRSFGATCPPPRAILMVSAHWEVPTTAVTAMPRPRTIHDFYGFPEPLFEVRYPAPGAPAIAEEIAELVKPTRVALDHDSWGLDHGTWSVLVHAFPKAEVPVLQLSLKTEQPLDYHLELGARLAGLRRRGVLVMGSGNAVHNLRLLNWKTPELGFDWAIRFNEAVRETLTTSPADIVRLSSHPDFKLAVPTAEHFLPLVYIAGLAAASNERLQVLIDGYAYGSLSMACFGLGTPPPKATGEHGPSAGIPTGELRPEETNT